LLALPGFHPEVRLESEIRLQMWGNVPEFVALPLSECRLTLYVPAQGLDADFTLHGGRVFITAPKATNPVVVRVRFHDEIWDITLHTADTEIGIDLIGEPARGPLLDRDLPETPRALAYVGVLQGVASMRIGFQYSGELLGGAKWKWDSKAGRPAPAAKDDRDEMGIANRWSKAVPATPAAKDMAAAVAEMARRVGISQGPFDLEFDATIKETREAAGRRVLSVWMLGAVDSLGYLIDALESDDAIVRDAAAKTIQHWVAQEGSREATFTQAIGVKAAFTDNQRALVVALIRGPDLPVPAETAETLFEFLSHEKLAVRELARMQLAKLDPIGQRESNYDAASERRSAQATLWKNSLRKRMK
jgi:hypothetical protein